MALKTGNFLFGEEDIGRIDVEDHALDIRVCGRCKECGGQESIEKCFWGNTKQGKASKFGIVEKAGLWM